MKKIAKHLPHYFSLMGILVATVFAFILFSYDQVFLLGIAVATSAAYFSWGIIHHLLHGDLSFSVVLEYMAISVLGAVLLISLLFRAV